MTYTPNQKVLEKYADILVNFALGSGKGIKKGEVIFLEVPECAKPLLIELQKTILKSGGHYITHYLPDGTARHFFELAEEHHLDFFAHHFYKGRIENIDHTIAILAETNKKELEGIESSKILRKSKAMKPYKEWKEKKEQEGKYTWTLALYGTEAAAKEAGITLEEYWEQIIKACYLDKENPIEHWKKSIAEVERLKDKLDELKIEKLRIKGERVDLTIKLGKGRKWMGGSGRNIPSFEVFISPDWRGTEGHVFFDQPLYRYGNLMKDIFLKFESGKVVEATAKEGEKILKEMIATENADKIGEFSLTDSRLSRIDKFMAETLFDENFGGIFGNFHIALGSAYKDSYPEDSTKLKKEDWEKLGYNESVVHTDIVSSEKREVTAFLEDGSSKIIYKDGIFII